MPYSANHGPSGLSIVGRDEIDHDRIQETEFHYERSCRVDGSTGEVGQAIGRTAQLTERRTDRMVILPGAVPSAVSSDRATTT
ncbi:MAG TPA: hypothetical protein PLW80_00080, partial [Spirochaetales bacterium]|nr:hypothetical protein [Spirochaetales bacterium]